MKLCTINDINVYLLNLMNCQILIIICIFIYNNEIIYEVQCNRYFIPCIRWGGCGELK